MKKILITLLSILTLFTFTGCQEENVKLSPDEQDVIEEVILSVFQAAENQDINEYMTFIDKEHDPQIYFYTQLIMTDVLEKFKFSYVITDFKIIEADDSHAVVHFKQETRLLEGNDEDFEETRAKMVMKLNRYDDGWKIYDTSTEYSEPIK